MSSNSMARPREMIIAFRNDKAYLIMAAAVNDVELSGAVEHVLATWKWED